MYGAILGDIIGSPYEFDRGNKTKEFPLFSPDSTFTDDTVMSLAVAAAFMAIAPDAQDGEIRREVIRSMQRYGRAFPDAGYGSRFSHWLRSNEPEPYGSYGNGSAMRVSSAAWLFDDLQTVRRMARLSADVTHNHPEGIKGAEATAGCVFLARQGKSKDEIKAHVSEHYYPLDFTLDEIRPTYDFDVSCQGSVPQALEAFFESTSFEDAIRNAISIGGDSDTIGAITGSIAGAYYGVPNDIRNKALSYLDDFQRETISEFEALWPEKRG